MQQEKKYPIGGYAPGNYMGKCTTCGEYYQGDKRAYQCEPCAVRDRENFDALSPVEQEELMKRNIEAVKKLFKDWGKKQGASLAIIGHGEPEYPIGPKDESGQSNEGSITPKEAEQLMNPPQDQTLPSMPLPATDPFQKSKEGNKPEGWDSTRMIGRVNERFKELEAKQWNWSSFYNGWLEGRSDMLQQIKGIGFYKPKEGNKGRGGEVAFAEWIREQNYKPYAGSWYLNGNNYAHQPMSTRNLFEIWDNQQNGNNAK